VVLYASLTVVDIVLLRRYSDPDRDVPAAMPDVVEAPPVVTF
jgi:hypothetical protein